MMKRVLLLTWLLATFINSDLISQSKDELRNNFYDAESWILFEAYQDALPLYQQLLRKYPDNSNFKYRIGQCYMNIPGEKTKAVSYLEDAIKNINPKYKEVNSMKPGLLMMRSITLPMHIVLITRLIKPCGLTNSSEKI